MSYRSILSFLGPDRHCASRTDFAIQLARDLDCHLVGAAPTGLLPFSAFAGLGQGVTMADLGQQVWDAMVREARQRVETFRTACRQAGLKSFEALVDESDQAASITRWRTAATWSSSARPTPLTRPSGKARSWSRTWCCRAHARP